MRKRSGAAIPRPRRGGRPKGTAEDSAAIVRGLRRMVRALELYSQDVQRSYGLTGPQLWALKALQRDGVHTPNQLAAAMAVDQSSISSLLRRLERRGLVTRLRAPEDLRSVRIHLTSRGQTLAKRAPDAAQGRLLHGLQAMTPGRVRGLRRSVDTLVAVMEAKDVEARFFFSND